MIIQTPAHFLWYYLHMNYVWAVQYGLSDLQFPINLTYLLHNFIQVETS